MTEIHATAVPGPASAKPWTTGTERPFVRIERITKKFDDFTAVDQVSLEIYKGELFCLLGGSGCGKSTLLRMLAGFETPTSGRMEIDGQDMAGIPPYKRPTNMMFQSYALFPHMTVERNVAYGLQRDGLGRDEVRDRVAAMLKMVQLTSFATRKPHQLSGGQRQRVALARSLVKRPKLLLLDEPLGALDKKLREETQFELVRIQETLGVTFIVVTHDQEEAMTLSTRIGVMNAGRIVQVGEPPQIYEYPSSRFVADFVGSVNLFEGRVIDDEPDFIRLAVPDLPATGDGDGDGGGRGSVEGQPGEIHVGHGVSCSLDQRLWYAVRPEKMRLTRDRPEATNAYPVWVEDIAYTGNLSTYRLKLPSGRYILASKPNLSRWEEDTISWSEPAWVSWHDTAGVVLTQ
jgi:putrescine transport system ATP-binding protein